MGLEVRVEVPAGVGDQVGGEHGLAQGGEQPGLAAAVEPVGVGGQRGGLGQRDQPGEQPRAGVGGEVVDVGDPADADQLQREQAQEVAGGRDHRGARVAGRTDQGGQVEGDQLGDGQQQPGDLRLHPGRQVGELEQLGAAGMVAERGAALGRRADR